MAGGSGAGQALGLQYQRVRNRYRNADRIERERIKANASPAVRRLLERDDRSYSRPAPRGSSAPTHFPGLSGPPSTRRVVKPYNAAADFMAGRPASPVPGGEGQTYTFTSGKPRRNRPNRNRPIPGLEGGPTMPTLGSIPGISMPNVKAPGYKMLKPKNAARLARAEFDGMINQLLKAGAQQKADTAQELADLDSWFGQVGAEQRKRLAMDQAAGAAALAGHAGVNQGLIQAAGGNEVAAGLLAAGGGRDDAMLRQQAAATESLDNQLIGLVGAEGANAKRDRQNIGARLAADLALELATARHDQGTAANKARMEALMYNNDIRGRQGDWAMQMANMNLGVQQANAGLAMDRQRLAMDAYAMQRQEFESDREYKARMEEMRINQGMNRRQFRLQMQQARAELAGQRLQNQGMELELAGGGAGGSGRKLWKDLLPDERDGLVRASIAELTGDGTSFPSVTSRAGLRQLIRRSLVQMAGINNPSAVAKAERHLAAANPEWYAALS